MSKHNHHHSEKPHINESDCKQKQNDSAEIQNNFDANDQTQCVASVKKTETIETQRQQQIEELQRQLKTAQAEAAEAKDTLLRKAADLENTKKRLQTEKDKSVRLANKGILTDLLDVLDNFDRAFSAVTDDETVTALIDGVKMIENQIVTLLANKYDVKAFDSVGEIFDPEKHEAIALGEASENGEQIVLTEYQKGYTWGETILRTAKVVVSAPANK